MSARTSRSAFASAGPLAILGLLALAVTPVLAKEGAIAKLDTAVHRDAQPGSTIQVGWSVVEVSNDVESPLSATPFYLRLTGPDGSSNEATGIETPSGSGHYVATIVVPRGGIQNITVALAGYGCFTGGACQRADETFPLTDDALVTGFPVGVTTPTAPANPSAAPGSVTDGLVPLIIIGVGFAFGGGLTALIVTRRRQVRTEPTGR